jgi:uncharacterized protein (TIGR00369 family)
MVEAAVSRERTIRWTDPAHFEKASRGRTGLELLRAIADGSIPPPPISDLLGFRILVLEPSHVVLEFDPAEFMYSPLGTVHGGILTVLLDTAMGCAFQTTLSAGVTYTTIELKVNFVRPVTDLVGPLRSEGTVIHAGSKVATTEARLVDANGKLFAHSTSTLLVVPIAPA